MKRTGVRTIFSRLCEHIERSARGSTWLTRVKRDSLSFSNSFAGDEGADGRGVVASCSNGSGFFLCLRLVAGGDGGGLGGRW